MKLLNENRTVPILAEPGRSVDGVVRVRGVDLAFAGRGPVAATHEPVAIVVRDGGTLRRTALPARSEPGALSLAAALAPLAAVLVTRHVRRTRRS